LARKERVFITALNWETIQEEREKPPKQQKAKKKKIKKLIFGLFYYGFHLRKRALSCSSPELHRDG